MLNSTIVEGYIVKDLELKHTEGEDPKPYTDFRIGCTRDYRPEGGQDTDFINVKAWGKTAEFAVKNFKRGMRVQVKGRYTNREWKDENKNYHSFTYINAEQVYFGENKRDEAATGNAAENSNIDPFRDQNTAAEAAYDPFENFPG